MKVIKTKKAIRAAILDRCRLDRSQQSKKDSKFSKGKVGLVPTMGYLHAGHLALVKKSLKENEVTIVSLFVNPLQFGPKEDLLTYPHSLEKDLSKLRELGVDIVFVPTSEMMYNDPQTFVVNEEMGQLYCGKSRPIFFRGVLTVVLKLFHLITPSIAYFGKKDYQQLFLIKKMVKDLDLSIEIKGYPIVREKNGLALSSRNAYLKEDDLDQAAFFYQALKRGRDTVKKRIICKSNDLVRFVKKEILKYPHFEIDYIEVVSSKTLQPIVQVVDKTEDAISDNYAILLGAVYFKKIRLIDNIEL